MPEALRYPHVPKSTRTLRPGQFWAIPLSNGMYGCGRVVQLGGEEIPTPNRTFFGALQDWVDAVPPTAEAIAGAPVVDWGIMHIKAITQTGGSLLGLRPLEIDRLEPPLLTSAHGGAGTMLLKGAAHVRPAAKDEWGRYPVLRVWGYNFIKKLAERRLLAKLKD